MAKAKLGNPFIAEISSGQAAPQNQTAFSTKGIPFIRAGSLEFLCSGGDEEGLERVTDKAAKEYKLRLFPADTIVFAKSGMSAKIPRIYRLKDKCYLVSHLAAIIPCLSNVYPNYLEHYLKYNHPCSLISNDSYPSIRLSEIEEFEVILPSLDEQKKISEVFDAVDKLIHNRQLQLSKLDQLVKARFVEMFGDPESNPLAWKEEKLEGYVKLVGGYTFKSEGFAESGIPVLRIGNINAGFFKPDNLVFWRNDDDLEKYKIFPGDLVMSLTGTVGKEDYGNVCILDDTYSVYYLNQRNAKIRLSASLNKIFLAEILKFSKVKKKLTGISRGIRQANISNADIYNLRIPIPPINLQEEFASFVQRIDKTKTTVKQSLEKLETLKKSLMQEYFG